MILKDENLRHEVFDEISTNMERYCQKHAQYREELKTGTNRTENINEIFRIFHNIKALIAFIDIENLKKPFQDAEDILLLARDNKNIIEEQFLEWLDAIRNQFFAWQQEFQTYHETITRPKNAFLNFPTMQDYAIEIPKELLKKISILYVEDEKDLLRMSERHFKKLVKNFYIATNGEMGVEVFKEKRPDIVITDIRLPIMHGLDMIKRIREIVPNTPVIVLSAYDDKPLMTKASIIGVDNYLVKPFSLNELEVEILKTASTIVNS